MSNIYLSLKINVDDVFVVKKKTITIICYRYYKLTIIKQSSYIRAFVYEDVHSHSAQFYMSCILHKFYYTAGNVRSYSAQI